MPGVMEFVADQLRSPSGLFGRLVMPRFFDRSSAAINRMTLESLALEPDDAVLEVGFGSGDLLGRMAPLVTRGAIAGADFSPDMVGVCAKRFDSLVRSGGIDLRCATAEELPFEAETFTKACTVNTIYFWADPTLALKEMSRVLRPGGRIVVGFSVPAAISDMPFTKHGFTLYEPDEVRRLLQESGFSGVEMVPGSGPRGEFMCAVATKPAESRAARS